MPDASVKVITVPAFATVTMLEYAKFADEGRIEDYETQELTEVFKMIESAQQP